MSDLWQQLELSTELETDIPDTVSCVRQCLVDFSDRKIQVVSFHCLNKFFANVKIDGFVLDEKSSFKKMRLSFCSNWIEAYTASKKIGLLIHSLTFLLMFSIVSITRASGRSWNTVAIPELVLVVALCICCIIYSKWYAELMVLTVAACL